MQTLASQGRIPQSMNRGWNNVANQMKAVSLNRGDKYEVLFIKVNLDVVQMMYNSVLLNAVLS